MHWTYQVATAYFADRALLRGFCGKHSARRSFRAFVSIRLWGGFCADAICVALDAASARGGVQRSDVDDLILVLGAFPDRFDGSRCESCRPVRLCWIAFPGSRRTVEFRVQSLDGTKHSGRGRGVVASLCRTIGAVAAWGTPPRSADFWHCCDCCRCSADVQRTMASFYLSGTLAPCFAIRCVRHSRLRPTAYQTRTGALAQSDCRGRYRLHGLIDGAHPGRARAPPNARTRIRPSRSTLVCGRWFVQRLCRSVDVCCAWSRTCDHRFAAGRNISAG